MGRVFPNGPADSLIFPGDVLESIDRTPLEGMRTRDVAALILGDPSISLVKFRNCLKLYFPDAGAALANLKHSSFSSVCRSSWVPNTISRQG